MPDIKLAFEYSREHRTATIDNGVSSVIGDPYGALILLTLTRMDSKMLSEMLRPMPNGAFATIAGVAPEAENIRVLEFTAALRPNQAKQIVSVIQGALRTLTPAVRQQYGITDADLGPAA